MFIVYLQLTTHTMNCTVKSSIFINLSILAFGSYALAIPVNTDSNVNRLFRSTRLYGGEDAPEGYAPHMVALVTGAYIKQMVCGGSILSLRLVLTAAHCIDGFKTINGLTSSLVGVSGSNKWASTENNIKFISYINHPNWDSLVIKSDAGVLITERPIVETDLIKAIEVNFDYTPGGFSTSLTGWGKVNGIREENGTISLNPTPHTLQLLRATTLDPQECSRLMQAAAEELGWWVPHVDARVEICTLHSTGHGACHGDSGSALVAAGRQVGVVSWGLPCARGAPDVYARVSGFKDWLADLLSQW